LRDRQGDDPARPARLSSHLRGVGPGARRRGQAQQEIEATGLFTDVAVRRFDWEIAYTTEEYIRLLDTFSGHIAMAQWKRDRLYGEIRRRLAARPDGALRRHWGAVLNVARRAGPRTRRPARTGISPHKLITPL
jgi:hypothetical protein